MSRQLSIHELVQREVVRRIADLPAQHRKDDNCVKVSILQTLREFDIEVRAYRYSLINSIAD